MVIHLRKVSLELGTFSNLSNRDFNDFWNLYFYQSIRDIFFHGIKFNSKLP